MLPAWQDRAGELPGAGVLPAASTWQRRLRGLRDRLPGRRGRGQRWVGAPDWGARGAEDSLTGSWAGHVVRLGHTVGEQGRCGVKAPDTFCRSPLRWRPVRLFLPDGRLGRSRMRLLLIAGIRPWLCGAQGRGLLMASALQPGRLAPALAGSRKPPRSSRTAPGAHPRTRGEQEVSPETARFNLGSPPHSRGADQDRPGRPGAVGLTPARAGSSLPDLHLHLGKSPFHANFAMSATLASAARIPPPPPCFRRRALHA